MCERHQILCEETQEQVEGEADWIGSGSRQRARGRTACGHLDQRAPLPRLLLGLRERGERRGGYPGKPAPGAVVALEGLVGAPVQLELDGRSTGRLLRCRGGEKGISTGPAPNRQRLGVRRTGTVQEKQEDDGN